MRLRLLSVVPLSWEDDKSRRISVDIEREVLPPMAA